MVYNKTLHNINKESILKTVEGYMWGNDTIAFPTATAHI